MIKMLFENWWEIVIVIAALAIAIIAVIRFVKAPTDQKITMVKNWLLQAVTEAEKLFGGNGTGRIKLSYVYDLFLKTFPDLATVISFDMFSGFVDEVLTTFRQMLESNQSLRAYVGTTTETEVNANDN